MLSVRAEEQQVKALIGDKLDIAAVNAPKLCVVSGNARDLDSLKEQLSAQDIPFSFLQTSHGFHSRMMDAAVPPTVALLKSMTLGEAKTPIMSTVTGNWIQPSEINNPEYWGKNLRQTVRFNDGMEKLIQQGYEVFLEVGPGQTLTMLARQCLKKAAKTSAGSVDITDLISVASLPHSDSEDSDEYTIKKAMSVLWLNGRNLNWEIVNENIGQRISLPTYPFERKRHWIEPKRFDQINTVVPVVEGTPANQQPKASVGGQGNMHMGEDYSLQLCKAQIDIISKQIAILKKIH
jgi:acyl transferase domain-containing protein